MQPQKQSPNLEVGFQYYISFKPNAILEESEVQNRVPIRAAISVTETGELADVSFEVPKFCQSEKAVALILQHENTSYVAPRVFVVVPERAGDTVLNAPGSIDLDIEGRIVGLEVHWSPAEEAELADP
jgi:hypothetical protein